MAPKTKISKTEWSECLQCECIISSKDLQKHSVSCGQDVDHGFVRRGTLNGLAISPVPFETESGASLSESSKNSFVQISPSTMQICNLCIGRPVIVNKGYVMTGWPVATMQPACVGINDIALKLIGAKVGDLVTIQPFLGPQVPAKKLTVAPLPFKDFMSSSGFKSLVANHLNGQLLTTGAIFYLKYYGQECKLLVNDIVSPDDQIIQGCDLSQDTSDSSIVKDLSELSLNDSWNGLISKDKPKEQIGSKKLGNDSKPTESCTFDDEENVLTSTPVSNSGKNRNMHTPSSVKDIKNSLFRTPTCSSPNVRNDVPRFFCVTDDTEISVHDNKSSAKESSVQTTVTFTSIGGLDKQIEQLKEMIDLPLNQPQLFKSYGLSPPRGVLLYGPSGAGKTCLARAVASHCQCNVMHISAPEIWSKFYGETEGRLRSLFKDAADRSPTLVVIDDIDALCPKRDSTQNEVEKRVVASFLTLMDGLETVNSRGHVMVLGCTSKPDNIDPALRRPGRFDREIETGIPTSKQRLDILRVMLKSIKHSLSSEEIQSIADSCHGFVGADLSAVCKEAGLNALKWSREGLSACVTTNDIEYAMNMVQPSAMREITIDVPKVLWSDIGGQRDLKEKLKQAVEWPLKHPEAFRRLGIRPPRGILMYGPPGCSKTMIAKALATESGLNFIAIKGPELFSKWVGESERAVRDVFRKARSAAPSIIFFDEIDALAVERGSSSGGSNVADRVLAQLLTEIDGVEKLQDVTIVAATNRPDMIDKALQRPGRLDRIVYVPLPDPDTRREIFQIHMQKMPVGDDVSLDKLVSETSNYSGAEVTAVCNEAALSALQEDINTECVMERHFDQALRVVQPRITRETIKFYEDYQHKCSLHQM